MFLTNDEVLTFKDDRAYVGRIVKSKLCFTMYDIDGEYHIVTKDGSVIKCNGENMFTVGDKIQINSSTGEKVNRTIAGICISGDYFYTDNDVRYYSKNFKKVNDSYVYDINNNKNNNDIDLDCIYDAGYIKAINDMAEFFEAIEPQSTVFTNAIAKIKGEDFTEYVDFFITLHDNINGLIEFCDATKEVRKENDEEKEETIELTYEELKDIVGYDFKLKEE